MLRPLLLTLALSTPAAAMDTFTFDSIDGGTLSTADWAGKPVLVVNTASLCGYTPQYAALQQLYDRYKAEGLIVLAVPSDDFSQELDSDGEVKAFCEMQYGLDLPMTTISHVRGENAHPFFRWLAEDEGFAPAWNFSKVLIAPDGAVAATWGPATEPMSAAVTEKVEALLP